MKKIFYTFLLISPLLFISSCEEDVSGCTVASAVNYNSEANSEDGSCLFDSDGDGIYDSDEILGCTDSIACNFNINATDSDNDSCEYSELGYDCEGNFIEYVIGMHAEGGIVIYVDSSGEHGLVAALEDLTEGATDQNGLWFFNGYEWGCYVEEVDGAEGTSIGTGYQNTMEIVNQGCSTNYGGITAAQAALDYESEGYSDWYLPSKDELVEMNNTIGNGGLEGNIGGFENNGYWSSSEYGSNGAWRVDFGDGSTGVTFKFSPGRVRVIRSF